MTLFKLARRNMARNFFQYFLYFGSMIFSVVIFFTFVSIQYNGEVQDAATNSVKINTAFQAASFVLLIFVALFVWYSNSFFTKRRKKEIGLYALMGLRRKQIGWMLFYENLILGFISLAVGIFIGILLSKFFIMILMKLMDNVVTVHFSISLPAVLETIGVFLFIIVTASLYGYRLIYQFQLVELFHDEKKVDRAPKVSVLQALLAVVFISTSYWLVLQDLKPPLWQFGLPVLAFTILLGMIAGTYLLFQSLTVFCLKQMRKRKNVYYKGTHIIDISQLYCRMRENARVLTVIATMSTITLVSVGTSYSLYYKVGEATKKNFPHGYEYLIPADQQDQADQLLRNALRADGDRHKITSQVSVPALNLDVQLLEYDGGTAEFNIISETAYNQVAARYGQKDRIHLNENEATMLAKFYKKEFTNRYVGHYGSIWSEQRGKMQKTIVRYVGYRMVHFSCTDAVVVDDALFQKLSEESKSILLTQVDLSDQKHLEQVDDQFTNAMLNLGKKVGEKNPQYYGVFSYYGIYHSNSVVYGLMMFMGAFLGLVFLIATGSIIYFKQLNEAVQEKPQFTILKKLGLTNREIRGTIAKRVGFIFVLPLVMGGLHSTIALVALSRMLEDDLTIPVAICMGIYALIYTICYLFTVRTYSKMVTA
ncbi:ABC transporter permease [Sporolactobacillus sp. STCC-11]|uniref:ABC transporter permease n=1 Tax=Sporolactobacillus caesalpiniae TaxID=3230362 RepID=UPI003398552B